ncbi:MAG: hypothetical protein HYW86_02495 [Candidatus Roizmanbacteria bacterium]|nr:MAG: hypothetical protein HYW86_02495 [Candidatus Roizmanbacteria bacterium]
MKKETIIAIVLGIGLGVIVAVVLVIQNRAAQIKRSKPITTALNSIPTPLVKNINVEVLEINNPQSGEIVSSKSVTIKGKVAQGSLVIIQSQIKTQIIKDSPEKLEIDFPLAMGENIIHITVYPKDQQINSKEKELKIYYLDEK